MIARKKSVNIKAVLFAAACLFISPNLHSADYYAGFAGNYMPNYYWTLGCTPTSAAMILGYWGNDVLCSGYGKLISNYEERGNAVTFDNNSGTATDTVPDLLFELATAMGTSSTGSTYPICWDLLDPVSNGIKIVCNDVDGYAFSSTTNCYNSIFSGDLWNDGVAEISGGNPFIWHIPPGYTIPAGGIVSTYLTPYTLPTTPTPPATSVSGHSVAVAGYRDDIPGYFIVNNTWDSALHYWPVEGPTIDDSKITTINPAGGNPFDNVDLSAPEGGESWAVGSTGIVQWNQIGTHIAKVYIQYSLDGGATWPGVIINANPSVEGDNQYSWTIPNNIGNRVMVRIRGYTSSDYLMSADGSKNSFSIIAPVSTSTLTRTPTRTNTRTPTVTPTPNAAKTLSSVSVAGPASVNENSNGLYMATAYFSDGSSSLVPASWSVSGAVATIGSSTGQLVAGSVTSDTLVTVSAGYTYGGVTRTGTYNVTIVNVVSPTITPSLNAPALISPGNSSNPGPRISAGQATLSWNPVVGATGYNIYYWSSLSGAHNYTNWSTTSMTGMSVSAGGSYSWKVMATNGSSSSEWSTEYYYQGPLEAPSLISPGNSSSPGPVVIGSIVDLRWNPVAGADHYSLIVTENGVDGIYTLGNVNTMTLTLTNGSTYYWIARACTSDGNGNSSESTTYYFTVAAPTNTRTNTLTPTMTATGPTNTPTQTNTRSSTYTPGSPTQTRTLTPTPSGTRTPESCYKYVLQWGGNGSDPGKFNNPIGIDVDSSGNVYVMDRSNNRVQKFDSFGNFIIQWGTAGSGTGQFNDARTLAVDSTGNVYVAEVGNRRIQKFSSIGDYLTSWGSVGVGNGQFRFPEGIAFNSTGQVFVADAMNCNVQKFDSNGTYLSQFGSSAPFSGTGDGQFNWPDGLAIDSSNNIYVNDSSNYRIQKFNSSGTFLTKWGSQGNGNSQFSSAFGIAVDSSNNVFVADGANNRIQKFNGTGTYLDQWGGTYSSPGSGDGQLNQPGDVVVDSSGYVFVADSWNHRIQKYICQTATFTPSRTSTPTFTATGGMNTNTSTRTRTITRTPTQTMTNTNNTTVTSTATRTPSLITPTATFTASTTATRTSTAGITSSLTMTKTYTPTGSTLTFTHTSTPTSTGTLSIVCGGVDPIVGPIIFCDEFSSASLDSSKWTSGGNSVSQTGGILTLSADVTDQVGWVTTSALDQTKIVMRLMHWMTPGGTYFHPTINLRDGGGSTFAQLIFMRSSYAPDYCSNAAKYNKVLVRTTENSQMVCTVVGTANSDTYYSRWIETLLSYDATTGVLTVDAESDGTVDLTYTLPVEIRKTVHDIYINGYGWWTGHIHKLDYIYIGTGVVTVPTETPTPTSTWTPTAFSTATLTPTLTRTPTASSTNTFVQTFTPTSMMTQSPTLTNTRTVTLTPTPMGSATCTPVIGDGLIVLNNVFNPKVGETAQVCFRSLTPTHCTLSIYNMAGERVRFLFDGMSVDQNRFIDWNGENMTGQQVASGLYLVVLSTSSGTTVKKLGVLK